MLKFLYCYVDSLKTYQNAKRLLFKKIDDNVIILTSLYKKCYVNKREIEIKNRTVFVLFSKLTSL
jgi:hypothetical protein